MNILLTPLRFVSVLHGVPTLVTELIEWLDTHMPGRWSHHPKDFAVDAADAESTIRFDLTQDAVAAWQWFRSFAADEAKARLTS